MRVNSDSGSREAASIYDARMVQRIAEHDVCFTHQRGNNPGIRLKSGIEYQSRLRSFQKSNFAFQFLMEAHVSGYQARCPRTAAVTIDGLLCGSSQFRMIRETQIVVRRKIEDGLTIDREDGSLLVRYRPESP